MKPNIRTLDLNLLKVFEAVYEQGGISRAAESLHMTQPAVSLALKRLRETIGDELFIRAHRGMKPTHRAEELAGPIREALAVVGEALEQGESFDPVASRRVFKIAFGRYGELDLLPRILNVLDGERSGISIQSVLDAGQTGVELVASGDIDGCFDFIEPVQPQVEYCEFGAENLVVIARKGHPRLKGSINLREYFSERHVVMNFGNERREILEDFMAARGGTRDVMAAVNQYLATPPVVMQSDAIATVPQRMAEFEGFAAGLQILPLPFPIPRLRTYLLWHRSRSSDMGWLWLSEKLLALR